MKFSYPLIKKFLSPPPSKKKLVEALNLYSVEVEDPGGDVLEISLPSNRYSDAASHLGIAREAAAGLGLKLKNPVREIVNPPADQGFLEIKIQDKNLCPRYAARYFEIRPSTHSIHSGSPRGIRGATSFPRYDSGQAGQAKIGASPVWLQNILRTCGLKPINAVVDLMNYVMLEVGQPLHAFDADKIATSDRRQTTTKIIIRKAKNGEHIETLDGQKFALDQNDLVIADSEKALAIAGIKGGANSRVDKNTKRIIVEAANFDPVSIFKTSRKLKLTTDASLRFNHGLSPALVDWGLDRVTELLVKTGARLIDSVDLYPRPVGEEIIEFDIQKYERLIGEAVSAIQAKKYFRALGFVIAQTDAEVNADKRGNSYPQLSASDRRLSASSPRESAFWVRVPPWRTDIESFEDLAEEISRLSGYNQLNPKPPTVSLQPAEIEKIILLKDRVRQCLANLNLNEVYTYSFVSEKTSGSVEIENPVSQELKYLRSNLEFGLLKAARANSRFFETVRMFEIGKVFRTQTDVDRTQTDAERTRKNAESGQRLSASLWETKAVKEGWRLGIALAGKKNPLILELKGIFDELLKSLGLAEFSILESRSGPDLRIETDHRILGNLKLVHLEKGWLAAVGEINLDALLPILEAEREFKALPKYPAVIRDISILVSGQVRIGEVLQTIQDSNPKIIEDVDLIDEYTKTQTDAEVNADRRGSSYPQLFASSQRESTNQRSLTFRIVFQAEDRTLTDQEVNVEIQKISSKVKKKFRAEVR